MLPLTFESEGFFFKDYTQLTEYECGIILDWRNDPDVRKKLGTGPVSYLDFYDLLEALKRDRTNRYFYVTMVYPIGCIEVNDLNNLDKATYSMVAPELFDKGYEVKVFNALKKAVKDHQ